MKIRTRAVSWKSTFRMHRDSIWELVVIIVCMCVWVCLVRSPWILLQPIRTYDYYQFVIIVVVVAVVVVYWFIYFNCIRECAVVHRFLACPMHVPLMARTNRNSGRYASPFDHLSIIRLFYPLQAHFTSRTINGKYWLLNEQYTHTHTHTLKLWENVRQTDCRRYLNVVLQYLLVFFLFFLRRRLFYYYFIHFCSYTITQMLNVSKDLNPHNISTIYFGIKVHAMRAYDSICFNSISNNAIKYAIEAIAFCSPCDLIE